MPAAAVAKVTPAIGGRSGKDDGASCDTLVIARADILFSGAVQGPPLLAGRGRRSRQDRQGRCAWSRRAAGVRRGGLRTGRRRLEDRRLRRQVVDGLLEGGLGELVLQVLRFVVERLGPGHPLLD